MDIKEAIETLKNPTEWYEDELTLKLKYAKAKDMAIEALERTRWIPVSERLPAPFQGVFISNGQWVEFALWGCRVARYKKNYQLCKSATHWMQLPKAPGVE